MISNVRIWEEILRKRWLDDVDDTGLVVGSLDRGDQGCNLTDLGSERRIARVLRSIKENDWKNDHDLVLVRALEVCRTIYILTERLV